MRKLIKLSDTQEKICKISEGRHCVLAPPGSGKTELLVQRFKRALVDGVDPEKMICLTFTNRAARGMQERIDEVSSHFHIGNFHSFAVYFLKMIGVFKPENSILDEDNSNIILDIALDEFFKGVRAWNDEEFIQSSDPWIKGLGKDLDQSLLQDLGVSIDNTLDIPKNWIPLGSAKGKVRSTIRAYISFRSSHDGNFPLNVKFDDRNKVLRALGFEEFNEDESHTLSVEQRWLLGAFQKVDEYYTNLKRDSCALDFDDLIHNLLRWLLENKSHPLSGCYHWVQLDEAQDLNSIQWEIVNRITHKDGCMVVFADPRQGIFSFMGGHTHILKKNISGMKQHFLDENYRSPSFMVDFYCDYVQKNFEEKLDWLGVKKQPRKKNDIIYGLIADSDVEKDFLTERIVPKFLSCPGESVAILLRTNALATAYSETLHHKGIDHFIVSDFDVFKYRVAKDFMAFLEVLHSPVSRLPWVRLIASINGHQSLKESFSIVNDCFKSGILPHWFLSEKYSDHFYPPVEIAHIAKHGRLVVLDTETTGIDPSSCDIIQFAAVEIINGEIGESLNIYLRSDQDLGDSEAIHHISKEYLNEHGIPRDKAFSDIIEFIGDSPIAAHNMYFDISMLEANYERCAGRSFMRGRTMYCTMEVAMALDPKAPRYKLESLIERYNLPGKNTHDALDDVFATANLVLHLSTLVENKASDALDFYKKHSAVIEKVNGLYGKVWNSLREDTQSLFTFDRLFRIFLNLGIESSYKGKNIKIVKSKLIRHMSHSSDPAPLKKLLEKDFGKYLLYKESDLILDEDRLIVSTIHRAKGLEFDRVIVGNCHSRSYPSYFARVAMDRGDNSLMEEDKRVLFVAITRAKKSIVFLQPEEEITPTRSYFSVSGTPFLEGLGNHFDFYDFSRKFKAKKKQWHKCPSCGHRWPFDGSYQGDDRCFKCGYIP